jgi:hypothetical protein
MKVPNRPFCAQPGQCKAKGRPKQHCASCARKKVLSENPVAATALSELHRARSDERFPVRYGVPLELRPVVKRIALKTRSTYAEAAAIVRRDLVKGARTDA